MNKLKGFVKWLDLRSVLKRFVFFLIVTLFLESVFALVIFDSFEKESIINIFLYSSILASILSMITGLFKGKVVTLIILFIEGLLFSIQLVFTNTFKTPFSLSI